MHPVFEQALKPYAPTRAHAQEELLSALYVALPFVEDLESDTGYKPGAVKKAIEQIKQAIANAEKG